MFDREKQIVINKFCDVIFKDYNEITLGKIISLPIPEAIKKYFDEEVKQRLDRELAEIKNFSTFDFKKPEVQPLLSELSIVLKITRSFNINEFSTSLKSALDFTIDYLLRPCETLTYFVFDYKDVQPAEFIFERLKYVKDYEYLPEIIKGYLKRKRIDSIEKKEFLLLVKKADKEFTKEFTILDHYETFKSFKDYLYKLDLYLTSNAEAEAFQIFLADKGQDSFAAFVEEKKKELIDPRLDFKAFLQSVSLPRTDAARKSSALDFLAEERKSLPIEGTQQPIMERSSTFEPEHSIEAGIGAEIEGTSELPFEPSEEKFFEEETENASKLKSYEWKENALLKKLTQPEESKKSEYARNLDGMIKNRLRKLTIKKLFNGSETEYYSTIALLDKADNWDEASQFLTDLFHKRNIQPYSKAAIKFTEFLYDNIR
jgi:hypothetical protein